MGDSGFLSALLLKFLPLVKKRLGRLAELRSRLGDIGRRKFVGVFFQVELHYVQRLKRVFIVCLSDRQHVSHCPPVPQGSYQCHVDIACLSYVSARAKQKSGPGGRPEPLAHFF